MTKTIFAHTPPGSDFPPFVNLLRQDGAGYTLTVRSQGNAGRDIASIALPAEVVEALATDALADLYREPSAPAVTNEMVSRFLAWELPADFNPDGGVSKRDGAMPVGTNLLTAVQARAMLEHVLGVAHSVSVALPVIDPGPDSLERAHADTHASSVLYPAIKAAMKELQSLHPGFNDAVNRAFNHLHGAFWSECPAPASAAPKRPEGACQACQ